MTVLIKQLAVNIPDRVSMEPVFLDSKILLSIWECDYLCSQVKEWEGEPNKNWFKNSDPSSGLITVGKAFFSEGSLSFENGRHRTRWMLLQGLNKVPVLLFEKDLAEAVEFGLCLGLAEQDEEFT